MEAMNMNNEQMKPNNKAAIALKTDYKTIVIENLSVEDEETYQLLQETAEDKRTDMLVASIRIGAIGLKRMQTGKEMDFIRSGFDSMITKFDKLFDPNLMTSYTYKLSSLLNDYFDKGGTVENILNPQVENSPLGKLRREILSEFKELRDTMTKKKTIEEVSDKTTLKGYRFEDECEDILSEFVSKDIGDDLEKTTNKCGKITGSFAGDFVISLRDLPGKKIVIETKNVDTVTGPQIIKDMEQAIVNREAKYGIFVTKYMESVPRKYGFFHEFNDHICIIALGNKTGDTLFPLLLFVVQWAKLKLQKETSIQEETFAAITEGIFQIGRKLDRFTLIKTQCSNIQNSSAEIKELATTLKNDIEEHITKMRHAISSPSAIKGEK